MAPCDGRVVPTLSSHHCCHRPSTTSIRRAVSSRHAGRILCRYLGICSGYGRVVDMDDLPWILNMTYGHGFVLSVAETALILAYQPPFIHAVGP